MSDLRDSILKTTRRWAGKTLATLLDHGIVSVSNFLVSIVLARIVSESDYGYFAIAFSFFLFFSSLSQALILEPLNVLGTLSYAEHPQQYFQSTFEIQSLVSVAFSLVIGLDCFSRNIIGHAFGLRPNTELWVYVLQMAVQNECSTGSHSFGIHPLTDNGSQLRSEKYGTVAQTLGI